MQVGDLPAAELRALSSKKKKKNKISLSEPSAPSPKGYLAPGTQPPAASDLDFPESSSVSTEMASGAATPSAALQNDPNDEKPIVKSGPASFQELLERELARGGESGSGRQSISSPANSDSASKPGFLRRGSGVMASTANRSGKKVAPKRQPLSETNRGNTDIKFELIQKPASPSVRGTSKIRPSQVEDSNTWDDIPVNRVSQAQQSSRNREADLIARRPQQLPTEASGRASLSKPVRPALGVVIGDSIAPQHTVASVANNLDEMPVGGSSKGQTRPAPAARERDFAQPEFSTSDPSPAPAQAPKNVARKLCIDSTTGLDCVAPSARVKPAESDRVDGADPEHFGFDSSQYADESDDAVRSSAEDFSFPVDDKSHQGASPAENDESYDAELKEFESMERRVYNDEISISGNHHKLLADLGHEEPLLEGAEYEDEYEDDEIEEEDVNINLNFDESETWGSPTQTRPEEPISDAARQDSQHHDYQVQLRETAHPLRSQLVDKLFNKKSDRKTTSSHQVQETPPAAATEPEQAIVHADIQMQNKMKDLEKEISEFRRQNKLLQELRMQAEAERDALTAEKDKIADHWRDAEERFDRYKETEMKKLKQERKDSEKQLALWKAQVQDLRAQNDTLKNEMQVVQDDSSRRDKKLRSEIDRLKKKLEDATVRNEELARELKFSEEARMAMQDREHLAQMKSKVSTNDSGDHSRSLSLALSMSPNEQNDLASQIADTAVCVEQTASGPVLAPEAGSRPSRSTRRGSEDSIQFQDLVAQSSLSDEPLSRGAKADQKATLGACDEPEQGSEEDTVDPSEHVISEKRHGDGKIERTYADGKRLLVFSNGTRKTILPQGGSMVHFNNGDIKESHADGRIVYFYADAKTSHTTHPDGLEIFEFSNGQKEKHFTDGSKEILFPDSTLKYIYANKEEESVFPDGTVQRNLRDGTRVIEFVNGKKETINPDGTKTREYPSGRKESDRVGIKLPQPESVPM